MYSENNEAVCRFCVYSSPVKGILTHVSCSKIGGYMQCNREGCEYYSYDIFKRPVHRKKPIETNKYPKEDFKL